MITLIAQFLLLMNSCRSLRFGLEQRSYSIDICHCKYHVFASDLTRF